MRENNHVVSQEEIRNIHSMNDPAARKLASETPEGKNQFYHVIGTMGGCAVRDKYASLASMGEVNQKRDSSYGEPVNINKMK